MILQALVDYYHRKAADPDGGIAPEGWEYKEIPFIIVIDEQGRFVQLEDTRSGEGKKRMAKSFLVPAGVMGKTSGVKADLLWDKLEYVLGINVSEKRKVNEKHFAFKERSYSILNQSSDEGALALIKFLESVDLEALGCDPLWKEMCLIDKPVSFRLLNDLPSQLIVHRNAIKSLIQPEYTGVAAICSISGEKDEIQNLHPLIRGVGIARAAGAIVSFNHKAFASYGKEQNFNAPAGKSAVFAYTTALNRLLAKGSKQRMEVGDASTVFWADRDDSSFEGIFVDLFGEVPKDDPDQNVRAVESLFKSARTGVFTIDEDPSRFHVLGIMPTSKGRIGIRFWLTGRVLDFAVHLRAHFDDISIVHCQDVQKHLSLKKLLVAVSIAKMSNKNKAFKCDSFLYEESENIPPNLGGDLMRSILQGTPYPQTLLQGALRRIRATQQVSYPRAAIIKAVLNRQNRYSTSQQKELTVSLDPENTHVAYLLGRLFAVLEKIQKDAQPGINATIRERFYGSFSASPASVFAILMRLKNHHLAKLSEGSKTYYEKMIGEIMALMPSSGVPSHLALPDQGCFAIGYYHQNHALYTKKD
ncbi:MAG: type I-C CRISPR-associated protein Cas8c/Csd1 [Campylobacterales bacterium]|nr:type I-C CRISPR-associated protein Cas8c/Csd1 [Campylobacterales bacterium]